MKRTSVSIILSLLLFVSPALAQTSPQSISLKEGFNFIAFTLKPSATPEALKASNVAIDEIYSYSAASGSFLSVSDGTLVTLNAGRGYIVKAKAAATLSVAGDAGQTVGNITLKAGFNLTGFSKVGESIKFTDLMKKYPVIQGMYRYSPSSGSFIQVVSDASGVPQAVDGIDPQVAAAQSYFINIKSDTTLNYDGPSVVIGNGTVTPPPSKTLVAISLSKTSDTVQTGAAYDLSKLTVTASYSDTTTATVSSNLAWVVSSGSGTISGATYTAPATAMDVVLDVSYSEGAVTQSAPFNLKVIAPAVVEQPVVMSSFEKSVWDSLNSKRQSYGKSAYIEDGKVTKAARDYSQAFAATKQAPSKQISQFIRDAGLSDPGYSAYIYFTNSSSASTLATSVANQMASTISDGNYNLMAVGDYGVSPNRVTTVIFMRRELTISSISIAANGNKFDITVAGKLILDGIGFALEGKWLKETTGANNSKIYDQSFYTAGTLFTAVTSVLKDNLIHKILFSRDTDNDPTNDTYSGHQDSNYFFVDTAKSVTDMVGYAAEDTSFTTATDAQVEQEIFQRINSDRAAHGLNPLVWDENVAEACRWHSRYMSQNKAFGHFEGTDPNGQYYNASRRVRNFTVTEAGAGENVSTGNNGFTVHEGLMSSPGHYDNLVNPSYNAGAVGVVRGVNSYGSQTLYVTENFVTRKVEITGVSVSGGIVTLTAKNLTSAGIKMGTKISGSVKLTVDIAPGETKQCQFTVPAGGMVFAAVDITSTGGGGFTYFYGNYFYVDQAGTGIDYLTPLK